MDTNPPTFDLQALWDYNDPAASEARFQAQLAHTPPETELALELQTQIARAQGLQRRFDEGHRTLDAVQAQIRPGQQRAQIRTWLERGRLFNSAGAPALPRPLFLQAWDAALPAGEKFLAVDAAHMLAIVEPPAQQLAWAQQAIAVAEQSNDDRTRGWLGSLYNNLGWTYHDLGEHEAALATFEKALAWRKAAGSVPEIRIAEWSVARILRALDRPAEALTIQRRLEAEWAADGGDDGYVLEEIGECLLALGDTTAASPYFARAYDALHTDPWLASNEAARLERLRTLGQRSLTQDAEKTTR
jgi:tetratricopeptide (TPR) repeat protein